MTRKFSERPGQFERQSALIRIAHVTLLDTEKKVMRGQIRTLTDDVPELVTILHPAGLTSRPKPGDRSAAVVFSSGAAGSTRYALLLGDVDNYNSMEEGDTFLTSPDNKDFRIKIQSDGTLTIAAKNIRFVSDEDITLKAKNVKIDSDSIEAGGDNPLRQCDGDCTSKLKGG